MLAALTIKDETFRKGLGLLLDATRDVLETNKIAAE